MNVTIKVFFCFLLSSLASIGEVTGQTHSVAREWNEALLKAIRADFARPTIHARNLFHTSIAMYDAWAVYDDTASTYFLNHSFRHFYCPFKGIEKPDNIQQAQEEAMSFAVFRLLSHRFRDSPGAGKTLPELESLFARLGYDASFTSTDYSTGSPAALGNYLAEQLISFGLTDGANESGAYQNLFYQPKNHPIDPFQPGNYTLSDPNRWQPLALETFVDQGGVPLGGVPPFLSAEWGKVMPFALKKENLKTYSKGRTNYWVYHDPGTPPLMKLKGTAAENQDYAWNFSLVSIWGSHLDPADSVLIDISPASNGNIENFPASPEEFRDFYHINKENHSGRGYSLNPATGKPYQPQLVPRGDYTRVLAEFWADGPDSETPPGHWFTILNYVNDHPLLEKRFAGKGAVLDALEWDVKSYFILGGAVHDAAIAAWGIKGFYDYLRPVSAIRGMADRGQSSDPELPAYHPAGLPLVPGYIELVKAGDPLAGPDGQNVNKIKIYSWRGPEYIAYPESRAGVGWILAENWWPYQRPDFVTPPFAGYISGHSTFSRAAAEALTLLTGDAFFPGGMSEFRVRKDRFLVFEKGPSVDLVLQWATYRDAADQCSLSRIWGGIHPPADDIPGRKIGEKIGIEAFQHATPYFMGNVLPEENPETKSQLNVYPNPAKPSATLKIKARPFVQDGTITIFNMLGQAVFVSKLVNNVDELLTLPVDFLTPGTYVLLISNEEVSLSSKFIIR